MSHMDEILARCRVPGNFVARSRFSLSKDKAMEKIREFSLRHPKQYVLELLQAANFAGANYIAVNIEPDQLVLAWVGGPPIQESQLERIFDYLFIRSTRSETRHLHQLAIGLNALLQRKPEVLRLESGDGSKEGTTRLELSPTGDGVVGSPEDPLSGTYLMVKFKRGWLKRFSHSFGGGGTLEEVGLIEENCLYTPVPILLNGRAPFGWKSTRRVVYGPGAQSFDENGRRGSLQVPGRLQQGQRAIHLVVGGVRVTSQPIPELGHLADRWSSLVGVICDDGLRKTADQSGIVQDEAWAAMLHAVQPFATKVIRGSLGRKAQYRAPDLPAVELATDAPAPVELPEQLRQLAPRPLLSRNQLPQLVDSGPVFYVQERDEAGLRRGADPLHFPYPVVILSNEQAESAAAMCSSGALHRISSEADVAFIRRALERGQNHRSVSIPFIGETCGISGTLELRLTISGPRPAWADSEGRGLPAAMVVGEQTHWCDHLALNLPGVQALLHCDSAHAGRELAEGLELDLAEAVHAQSWHLLKDLGRERKTTAVRTLMLGLLAHHARAHVYRERGCLKLDTLLPPAWGSQISVLLKTPLIETATETINLARLASLQGTDEVIEISSLEDLEAIEALEARFGYGHLRHPTHLKPLLLFAGVPSENEEMTLYRVDPSELRTPWTVAFWLSAERRPRSFPNGWVPIDCGVPHLSCGMAEEMLGPVDPGPWLEALAEELADFMASDNWVAGAPDVSRTRARAALRMAILGIAKVQGTNRVWNPETLEEIILTEQITGSEFDLELDDAPSVWHTLGDPTCSGWLIRSPLRLPGLHGWLGLRHPYDPSAGLLLQSFNHLWSESEPDPGLPCHGILTFNGPRDRLTDRETLLIRHAQHQLYRQLLETLPPALESPEDVSAHRYALHYIGPRLSSSQASSQPESVHLAALATQLMVFDGEESWGSLTRWLRTAPTERPALQVEVVEAEEESHSTVRHLDLSGLRKSVAQALGLRTHRAGSLAEGIMPLLVSRCSIWPERSRPVRLVGEEGPDCLLRLDPETDLVDAALNDQDPRALYLLVLECCRVLATASRGRLDLHTAHQYLVAQEL